VSIGICAEVDPVIVVEGETPGSRLRGERAVVLPAFAGVGVHGIEKKGSIELTVGKIERIPGPVLSRPGEYPPAYRISNRDTEITERVCLHGLRNEQSEHQERSEKEKAMVQHHDQLRGKS
jgi:hypothetical protein